MQLSTATTTTTAAARAKTCSRKTTVSSEISSRKKGVNSPFSQNNEITGGASLIPQTVSRTRDLGAERKGDMKRREGAKMTGMLNRKREMREGVGEAPL